METILVIEDDLSINNLVKEILENHKYEVIQAYSGTEGVMAFNLKKADLIILDLMLPGKNGKEVVEIIRKTSSVPIIMLTAVSDKDEVVSLLKNGANDYITKPFNNKELIARIEVWFRSKHTEAKNNDIISFKDIKLDFQSYKVAVMDKEVSLSKREFEILACLMKHPKKVFTKENLYTSVWNDEFYGDDNIINVHVSKIRSKLKVVSSNEYIQTVWGIGFRMVD